MNLRLTTRDYALMRWINRFGFAHVSQIAEWMGVGSPVAYARLKKLLAHGYVQHQKIAHDSGVYLVTRLGVQVANSTLPPFKKVSLQTYHHQLQVVTLSMELLRRFGGHYLTERELRQELGQEAFGMKVHLSDGDLVFANKRVAIELELNKKSKRRREGIFNHYQKSFQYQEVWYFCSTNEVSSQLEPYLKEYEWLRVYRLNEFIHESN